jgi:hypothetical protein
VQSNLLLLDTSNQKEQKIKHEYTNKNCQKHLSSTRHEMQFYYGSEQHIDTIEAALTRLVHHAYTTHQEISATRI